MLTCAQAPAYMHTAMESILCCPASGCEVCRRVQLICSVTALLEETDWPFLTRYPLQIASWYGVELCVHLLFVVPGFFWFEPV